MITEQVNKLFEKKNLTELLSHTLLGLSIVKERFKEYFKLYENIEKRLN